MEVYGINDGYNAFIEIYENINLKDKGELTQVEVIKPLQTRKYKLAKKYLADFVRFEDTKPNGF